MESEPHNIKWCYGNAILNNGAKPDILNWWGMEIGIVKK